MTRSKATHGRKHPGGTPQKQLFPMVSSGFLVGGFNPFEKY